MPSTAYFAMSLAPVALSLAILIPLPAIIFFPLGLISLISCLMALILSLLLPSFSHLELIDTHAWLDLFGYSFSHTTFLVCLPRFLSFLGSQTRILFDTFHLHLSSSIPPDEPCPHLELPTHKQSYTWLVACLIVSRIQATFRPTLMRKWLFIRNLCQYRLEM